MFGFLNLRYNELKLVRSALCILHSVAEHYPPCLQPLPAALEKSIGLALLRACNSLLSRLSKNQHSVFYGRILIFMTSAFTLGAKSGVNLRGDTNFHNETIFEELPFEALSDEIMAEAPIELAIVKEEEDKKGASVVAEDSKEGEVKEEDEEEGAMKEDEEEGETKDASTPAPAPVVEPEPPMTAVVAPPSRPCSSFWSTPSPSSPFLHFLLRNVPRAVLHFLLVPSARLREPLPSQHLAPRVNRAPRPVRHGRCHALSRLQGQG